MLSFFHSIIHEKSKMAFQIVMKFQSELGVVDVGTSGVKYNGAITCPHFIIIDFKILLAQLDDQTISRHS